MSLAAFVARRLLWFAPLVVLVMLATFALMRGTGGSPFRPPEGYTGVPFALERELRAHYHLDEPWFVEFAIYVKNVFTLNFGPSLVDRYLSVDEVIRNAFPISLELVFLASAVAVPAGIALGALSALKRNSLADLLMTATATAFLVVPVFFVTFVLSTYLVSEWHVFPGGWESWEAKVLPVTALALAPLGYTARLIRAAVVETLQEDYVRAARAKGMRAGRLLVVHVLPNSVAPFLSAAVPMIALLVTGALFVETSFGIPGASAFFLQAAKTRDYPLMMGLTVVLAVVVLTANLLSDVLLAMVDPRVREGIGA